MPTSESVGHFWKVRAGQFWRAPKPSDFLKSLKPTRALGENRRTDDLPTLRRTHAAPAMGFDEHFAFVCSHCGESVTVEPPKVQ
jgi:hypothetical protein